MIQKTILNFLILCFVIGHAYAQEEGLAQVYKINGKEAYILSEPLRTYEVVLDVGTGLKGSSLLTQGLVNEGVSDKSAQFVRRIQKAADKENIEYDAVIYSSGKRAVAIKFTEEAGEKRALAKVKKMDGVEIYIQAEPLKEYEILETKKGGFKAKSYLSGGLVNNSIEQDVSQFVRKFVRRNKETQAIIYSAGKSAMSVKFK
ncbi:MAG: hypothetical protein AAF696_12560 [Bacteroidota bacterium]